MEVVAATIFLNCDMLKYVYSPSLNNVDSRLFIIPMTAVKVIFEGKIHRIPVKTSEETEFHLEHGPGSPSVLVDQVCE